jgi:hypothetical protein
MEVESSFSSLGVVLSDGLADHRQEARLPLFACLMGDVRDRSDALLKGDPFTGIDA